MSPAEIVTALNDAFINGTPDSIASEVEPYFTDDAVVVSPDLTRAGRGRKAIAQSYVDFKKVARIIDVWTGTPHADHSGDVAVATLAWRMTYEIDETKYSEEGDDIYVFRRDGHEWRIFWRAVHSHPAKH